jgi:hypothetical protein
MLDAAFPSGMRYRWRSTFLERLNAGAEHELAGGGLDDELAAHGVRGQYWARARSGPVNVDGHMCDGTAAGRVVT